MANFSQILTSDNFLFVLEFLWDFLVTLVIMIFQTFHTLYLHIIPIAPKSLVGETILITGSAQGIGRETCLKLAKLGGATLVCWDIQEERNQELVQELNSMGTSAFAFTVDISDQGKVHTAAEKVKREVGHVTIVINNAGIMCCDPFLSQKPIEWERTFRINVLSHFWILNEFLPRMVEENHGHVVSIASGLGYVPVKNVVAYCSSKAAVIMYMETLRQELRYEPNASNVHLSTVYPSGVQTDLIKGLGSTTRLERFININLKPEIVAEAIVYGLRRNQENIYAPSVLLFSDMLIRCLPSKVITSGVKFIKYELKKE